MRQILRFLLVAVIAVLLLAAGLVAYIRFGDLSIHKDRILAAASDATGFSIAGDGPFDLQIGKKIVLSAGQVVVRNPEWPEDAALALLGDLDITIDTWSVVSGPLEIDNLELNDTEISLKEGADGRANWQVPARPVAAPTDAPGQPEPILHSIVLNDVRLLHEPAGEIATRGNAARLKLSRSGHNAYDFDLETGVGQSETFAGMVATGTLGFTDSVSSITSLRVDFAEAELALESTTTVNAAFSGFATVDVSLDKPNIELNIEVSLLDVPPTTDTVTEAVDKRPGDSEFLFDTKALAYSWLDALDLTADIRVARAAIAGNDLQDVHVVVEIADASLRVDPFGFSLGDGTLAGSMTLAPNDALYALDIAAQASNLRLTQLAEEGQEHTSLPPLNATLQLAGAGASMHDIMASADGRLVGRQEDGQLNLQAINALFSDFLTSIVRTLNPLAEEQPYANIECGIYEIDIVEGIATIEEAAIQSDRMTIVGSGKIDLRTEEIDMVLRTKSREGLGLSVGGVANSFLKLGGTLKEPALGLDAAGSVTTTGAAVATGGLSLLAKSLWDRVSSEVDMCSKKEEAQ